MTKEKAIQEMAALKANGKLVVDITFKEQCIDIVKEEVSVFEFSNDDFHFDSYGNVIDYRYTSILRLAEFAGISIDNVKTQKSSNFGYTATATGYRNLPSGSRATASGDYDYNADLRGDITINKAIIAGKAEKYRTGDPEKDKAQEIVTKAFMAQYGCQKADTGARKRVYIQLLHLPSATEKFKNKYKMIGAICFISKVIPNNDHVAVKQLMLQSLFPGTAAAYGAQPVRQIETSQQPPAENQSTQFSDPFAPVDPAEDIIADPEDFSDLDAVADAGFSTVDNGALIKQFFTTIKSNKKKEHIAIVEFVLNTPGLYADAVSIINDPGNTVETCIIKLYLLHDSIKSVKMQDGKTTRKAYVQDKLVNPPEKGFESLIKVCYNACGFK